MSTDPKAMPFDPEQHMPDTSEEPKLSKLAKGILARGQEAAEAAAESDAGASVGESATSEVESS